MKLTKRISLLLVLALIAAMFAACGSSSASSTPAEAASSAAAQEDSAPAGESAAEEAPAADETPAEEAGSEAESAEAPAASETSAAEEELLDPAVGYELPLFDPAEGVSFSCWVSFSEMGEGLMPNGYGSNLGYLQSVEDTGVTLDFVQISTEANQEQFNLMIASGDYVDIITNVQMLWTGSYDSAIEEDIFIDLNEMTQNYMPFYKQAYDQLSDNVKRDLHTDGGNMPKLISINRYPTGASEGAFVRQDILDKLGLEMPETYDELDKVLKAMQSSGMAEPLMLTSGIVHMSNALCSGFGVNGGFSVFPMTSIPWMLVDGEVKYGIVEEGYKEYMQMVVDYYKAGIIDPDFVTENTNPMGGDYASKCASDDVGVFFGETGMVPEYFGKALNPDYDIQPLPPITKEAGEVTHFGTYKSEISGRLSTISICSTAADRIEDLGRYLDYFFTDKGALLTSMGVEGNEDGSYIWDENGELQYSDYYNTIDIPSTAKANFFIGPNLPALVVKTPSNYQYPVQEICADVWDSNTDAEYRLPDYLTLTVDENEKFAAAYSDIQTLVSENLIKFVTGDRSMDEWDGFVQELWDMGLQDCLDLEQAAYERYLGREI